MGVVGWEAEEGEGGCESMGHKSLQVPVPHSTPVLVQSLTPTPSGPRSDPWAGGSGTGRGSLETKLEAPLCLPGVAWRAVVKPYSVLKMEGGVGHKGAAGECIQNNKTLDLCLW